MQTAAFNDKVKLAAVASRKFTGMESDRAW